MRTRRTLPIMMLGPALILACMLAPAPGIATEPSVNGQLAQAAKNGDMDRVKTLLAKGANVNAKADGRPVLMWALDPRNRMRVWPMLKEAVQKAYLRSVNLELVKFLMDQGADVNAKDSGGYTALMCAVQMADFAVVKYLLDKGADVNARGVSRPYAVVSGGNKWERCMRSVRTALMLAAESRNLEIMEFLIDKGADVNVKDNCGCTTLMEAGRWGRLDVVKSLIRNGANVNVRDNKGRTALMFTVSPFVVLAHRFARRPMNEEVLKLLVDKGADVNAGDKDGRTPLIEAAWRGNLETVKLLVDSGADVNVKDKDGRTPLSYASAKDKTAVVQYLKAHGAK